MAEKRKPLIVSMAEEVTAAGATVVCNTVVLAWDEARALAARIGADTLAAFIEDVEWDGEDTVSLARLKRFHEALAALREGQ